MIKRQSVVNFICSMSLVLALLSCAPTIAGRSGDTHELPRMSVEEADAWYARAISVEFCAQPYRWFSARPSRVRAPIVAIISGLSVVERGEVCFDEDLHACLDTGYVTVIGASDIRYVFGGDEELTRHTDRFRLAEMTQNLRENLWPLVHDDGRYLIFGSANEIGFHAIQVTALCDISSADALARIASP